MTTSALQDRVSAVIEHWVGVLGLDDPLLEKLNDEAHIYRRHSVGRIEIIPGVYWSILSAVPAETLWDARVLWDVWAQSDEACEAIGNRLIANMHHPMPIEIDNALCWSQFVSLSHSGDPEAGVARRLYLFQYRPLTLD